MENNTCCFFGHRTINETDELRNEISETVEKLITEENVDTFLFGSRSSFDSLCREVVTELKAKYPYIKRIYVRAEFPYINDDYLAYLLRSYDDTYFPDKIKDAGKAVYIERNYEMINKSKYCIVYCNESIIRNTRKSGTKTALDYAEKKGRRVIKMTIV